jgi:site-specific DNA recombinase
MADTPIKRCVIYTRKSSEEGLEQDYNSLHAQREACEAFVRSQTGEGWRPIKTAYDDGGFSGGSMERPASRAGLGTPAVVNTHCSVAATMEAIIRVLSEDCRCSAGCPLWG